MDQERTARRQALIDKEAAGEALTGTEREEKRLLDMEFMAELVAQMGDDDDEE